MKQPIALMPCSPVVCGSLTEIFPPQIQILTLNGSTRLTNVVYRFPLFPGHFVHLTRCLYLSKEKEDDLFMKPAGLSANFSWHVENAVKTLLYCPLSAIYAWPKSWLVKKELKSLGDSFDQFLFWKKCLAAFISRLAASKYSVLPSFSTVRKGISNWPFTLTWLACHI